QQREDHRRAEQQREVLPGVASHDCDEASAKRALTPSGGRVGSILREACRPRAQPRRERTAPARGGTMHPGMLYWWKTRRGGGSCYAYADCGPSADVYGHPRERGRHRGDRHVEMFVSHHEGDLGAGAFGVRRPLRFLAYKLELDEHQVAELAR